MAVRAMISSSAWAARVLLEARQQFGADVSGDVEARVERAVVQVADQARALLVAGAGRLISVLGLAATIRPTLRPMLRRRAV